MNDSNYPQDLFIRFIDDEWFKLFIRFIVDEWWKLLMMNNSNYP
jgi:hypothetical protein